MHFRNRTFLDGGVPLDGPRLQLLRVHLLDLGALHHERREVRAESAEGGPAGLGPEVQLTLTTTSLRC